MSEPASLYARLTLDRDAYAAFLRSRPTSTGAYDDWQAWLDCQQMASPPLDAGVLDSAPLAGSVAEVFDAWHSDAAFGAPPIVLHADGRCRVTLMLATENYAELVHMLAPLRGAAAWTHPDADDFILVTDFLWSDDAPPMACMRLSGGTSAFLHAVPDPWRAEAMTAFESAMAYLESRQAPD